MFKIRKVTALPNGNVIVASEDRPAIRFKKWSGGKRVTSRFKWDSSEFHLELGDNEKFVLDGTATPDEVWDCVNGVTTYSVTDLDGTDHWFNTEDEAVAFVFEEVMAL